MKCTVALSRRIAAELVVESEKWATPESKGQVKIFWMISNIHFKKLNSSGDLKDIHAINYIAHPYCVQIHMPRHPSSAPSIKMKMIE